ncbi:nucleoside hydrolase [Roseinatronobacter sp. S2]|uniref:nucleoside hydrolase n=1 Tax=Roseinatronobacter sp. S2 TaxID=3035471 RepID=UPI00240FFEF6|nr:nucleoside hydrolase [Roseinatronobacter sp. S2]WFE74785.1 nucleoside hydrolase [Roseinatronobacter sp. S2]
MTIWVDTDLGFDDLWALLFLQRAGASLAGISLVAGNAELPQVVSNAQGAVHAYGLDAPLYRGADRPLLRPQETAARILGADGMQTRGRRLPVGDVPLSPLSAVDALAAWLHDTQPPRQVLALGPLTNLAHLVQRHPDAAARITRLVWMGGSNGPGNHSPAAEFNALADPEALACVLGAGLPLEVIDLMLCRTVTFGPQDMPDTDPLTHDLLGGYLDIGLSRGRGHMAIYDPVAALAMLHPSLFGFARTRMDVSTTPDASYGATAFTPDPAGPVQLAITTYSDDIAQLCLGALERKDPA